MNYIIIANTVFSLIFTLLGLLISHFIVFAIVGVFFNKKYPKTEKKLRYGVVIPARNEEKVLANLIKSIKASSYPADKLEVFLIAHNCTDNTADVGRELGIHVYEYNNPNECTKGYAFKYLFSQIEKDFGTQNFDGFIVFDADNIVCEDYFDKLNDAFVAGDRKNVVISFRNSKNFGENSISAMYGLYFMYGCRLEARGRAVLGCSTRVQGTGFVMNSEIVKDGWKYLTLTEDWEFTADQILQNTKIAYCDEAVFYDEQPTNFRVMWRQRLRWQRGHLLVFVSRYKELIQSLFKSKKNGGTKHKVSAYDFSINILPVGIIGISFALMHLIVILIAPFIGNYNVIDLILDYLKTYGLSLGTSYLAVILSAFVLLIIERKRIHHVNFFTMAIAVLLFPAFILLAAIFDVMALFTKNLGWKTIPHKNTTAITDIKPTVK